jgi:hypothetical protein
VRAGAISVRADETDWTPDSTTIHDFAQEAVVAKDKIRAGKDKMVA